MNHAFASKTPTIGKLIEHISKQQSAREHDNESMPSEKDRTERARMMNEVASELDMSEPELQTKLGINRSTWDRWKNMVSIPHPTHIESLKRFALEKAQQVEPGIELPRPLDMLSSSPWTYGRIRLVLELYRWENAVFHFPNPFVDDKTVADMASLALRDCRIVYLMNNAEDWAQKFIATMVLILGSSWAARALSHFCIIEIERESFDESFGVLNYEGKKSDQRVGYVWKGQTNSNIQPESIYDDQYNPFPADDDIFIKLNIKFASELNLAFGRINERIKDEVFLPVLDRNTQGAYISIPLIRDGKQVVDDDILRLEVSDRKKLLNLVKESVL